METENATLRGPGAKKNPFFWEALDPTVQELIHAPFEAAAWFVIMARAGTPADTLQKINAVTNRYLQSARGQELIAKQAVEAGGGTPADAATFVKLELEKWEPVIKAANISLD